MHKIFFDTETTGLNPENNFILTMYFAVCDDQLNVIDELDMKVKPDSMDGLSVEKDAMAVNRIDLNEHLASPETVPYSQAKVLLSQFLDKHELKGRGKSFQPCGHNIGFDKAFIYQHIMPQPDWNKYFHYREMDTSHATSFLKECGILPNQLGSLTSLVEYFKMEMKNAHTAKDDVLMNIEVFKHMKLLMNKLKNQSVSVNKNLLDIIEA